MDWESVHGLAGLLCFKVSHRQVLWLHLGSTWGGLAPKFIHRLQDSVRTESLSSFLSVGLGTPSVRSWVDDYSAQLITWVLAFPDPEV